VPPLKRGKEKATREGGKKVVENKGERARFHWKDHTGGAGSRNGGSWKGPRLSHMGWRRAEKGEVRGILKNSTEAEKRG